MPKVLQFLKSYSGDNFSAKHTNCGKKKVITKKEGDEKKALALGFNLNPRH